MPSHVLHSHHRLLQPESREFFPEPKLLLSALQGACSLQAKPRACPPGLGTTPSSSSPCCCTRRQLLRSDVPAGACVPVRPRPARPAARPGTGLYPPLKPTRSLSSSTDAGGRGDLVTHGAASSTFVSLPFLPPSLRATWWAQTDTCTRSSCTVGGEPGDVTMYCWHEPPGPWPRAGHDLSPQAAGATLGDGHAKAARTLRLWLTGPTRSSQATSLVPPHLPGPLSLSWGPSPPWTTEKGPAIPRLVIYPPKRTLI